MTTATWNPFFGNNLTRGISLTWTPDLYYMSDGTSWKTGAGTFHGEMGRPAREVVTGTSIRYEMKMGGDGSLLHYTDHNAGNHSSRGRLDPWGPLVIEATIGSKTATLNGYALIVSNETQPGWEPYSAPVGWAAPMTMTYTLGGNATWQPGIFDTSFTYRVDGEFRFKDAVPTPEPGVVSILAGAVIGAGSRRAGRNCARLRRLAGSR